ncbi:hypothetical protein GWI33_015594, partial [Rhynchophorus ferrugineus]
ADCARQKGIGRRRRSRKNRPPERIRGGGDDDEGGGGGAAVRWLFVLTMDGRMGCKSNNLAVSSRRIWRVDPGIDPSGVMYLYHYIE